MDLRSNNCFTICGDGVIAGEEECEDKNKINADGCHLCRFAC